MQVAVGRIGRPHGVRGAVTVRPATDDPIARFAPGAVLDTDPPDAGPLTVAVVHPAGAALVVEFAGITDRDQAAALRGTELRVDSAALPALADPEEYYDHQLIGLAVVDRAGRRYGAVCGVLHPPAAPVLEVATPAGEVLVPFVMAIVPAVDLPGGRLVVDPPDGMFED